VYRQLPDSQVGALTRALRKFRRKTSLTQAEICRRCWLDESYVSRLFSGERSHPSRDALILLSAYGMNLSLEATDELLLLAEYRPLALGKYLS
jgi:transcriptional regulator with XRE-family HTH domain